MRKKQKRNSWKVDPKLLKETRKDALPVAVCQRDKCGKGKGKNAGSENKNRGKGDKSREKTATSDWLAADGSQDRFQGANIEVRDRSGCPAPLDSHLHTHIPYVILSHVYCFHQPTFHCYWGNMKKCTPAQKSHSPHSSEEAQPAPQVA